MYKWDGKEKERLYGVRCLEVVVFLRQGNSLSRSQLSLILFHKLWIDRNLSRGKSRSGDEFETRVTNQLPRKPQERLLEVVVRFRGDLEVLNVLLSVEGNLARLYFSLLHINLVTAKNDRDVLANTFEITMPVGNILIGDTGGDVEHNDTALSLNVISIPETTEFLLSGSIPNVEANGAEVGGE